MHAQFANHPLFLFCFVLIYCHHQWCYTAQCSVSRADCMLTLHATLRLNGCDAYIFHRVLISRPGQLADNNNVVLLKRFVRPMTHSSTRDTDGERNPQHSRSALSCSVASYLMCAHVRTFRRLFVMTHRNDRYAFAEAKKLLSTTIKAQCTKVVPSGESFCVPGQVPVAMYPPSRCHYPEGCCACAKNCDESIRHNTESNGYFCPGYTPHPLTMTAANIFWPLAAINYVSLSGDYAYLKTVLPQLRAAVWMHTEYNLVLPLEPSDFPRMGLIRAPGKSHNTTATPATPVNATTTARFKYDVCKREAIPQLPALL